MRRRLQTPPSGRPTNLRAPHSRDEPDRDESSRDDPDREIAIVGDPHGCAVELEALLAGLDRVAPGARVILVGDLLTKGPSPEGVVRLLERRRAEGRPVESVVGNHDWKALGAIRAVEAGRPAEELIGHERRCVQRLLAAGCLDAARDLLLGTIEQVEIRGSGWTVLHAGIDPRLGLDRTPAHLKCTLKAPEGETPWWERYEGGDGLLVVGHKPLDAPLRRTVGGRPVAVNVDTGCVYGGALTAYLLREDAFVAVPAGTRRLVRAATAPQAASAAPARSSAA
jgi:diadenosine tetraphosphatase ApaH/serine/threonine PP2A family protein phosphatase